MIPNGILFSLILSLHLVLNQAHGTVFSQAGNFLSFSISAVGYPPRSLGISRSFCQS